MYQNKLLQHGFIHIDDPFSRIHLFKQSANANPGRYVKNGHEKPMLPVLGLIGLPHSSTGSDLTSMHRKLLRNTLSRCVQRGDLFGKMLEMWCGKLGLKRTQATKPLLKSQGIGP